MGIPKTVFLVALLVLVPACAGNAGFLQDLQMELEKHASPTAPSQQQMISAMRQALEQGSRRATGVLGRRDGFLGNPKVRIPVPSRLRGIEQGLRRLGQGKTADAFVTSLNRAAERATPMAQAILLKAIRKMSVRDVVNIIRGPENAATIYFRNKTSGRLTTALLPIVTGATNSVGVTRSYKNMVRQAGPLAAFIDLRQLDLDAYITRKTLDGIFLLIEEEELRIRKEPVARTTELLKKVFGGKW